MHLVCFDSGIVGHIKDECAKYTSEKDRGEEQVAGEAREITVNGEAYSSKVQVRKESTREISGEETFGPWMITQRKENRYRRNIQGRNNYRENQGFKEGRKSVEKGQNYNNADLEINSCFNVLYGLKKKMTKRSSWLKLCPL